MTEVMITLMSVMVMDDSYHHTSTVADGEHAASVASATQSWTRFSDGERS